MPRQALLMLLLSHFEKSGELDLEDVLRIANQEAQVSASEVKSAVLTLLRRHDIELTPDFRLAKAQVHLVA
jgi:hypothetical protein